MTKNDLKKLKNISNFVGDGRMTKKQLRKFKETLEDQSKINPEGYGKFIKAQDKAMKKEVDEMIDDAYLKPCPKKLKMGDGWKKK